MQPSLVSTCVVCIFQPCPTCLYLLLHASVCVCVYWGESSLCFAQRLLCLILLFPDPCLTPQSSLLALPSCCALQIAFLAEKERRQRDGDANSQAHKGNNATDANSSSAAREHKTIHHDDWAAHDSIRMLRGGAAAASQPPPLPPPPQVQPRYDKVPAPAYPPEILFRYPPGVQPPIRDREVCDLCFPHQVRMHYQPQKHIKRMGKCMDTMHMSYDCSLCAVWCMFVTLCLKYIGKHMHVLYVNACMRASVCVH